MHRKTIRIFIVLAVLSLLGMVVVQVYWFKQAFDIRRESFILKTSIALNNVGRRISKINDTQLPAKNLVEQLSINVFSVMVNQPVDPSVLQELIKQELNLQNLITDFEFAIYDCTSGTLNYGSFVCMDQNCKTNSDAENEFKLPANDNYFFIVHFPDSFHAIIAGMNIWLFSSGVLLIVFAFFSYSLFVILRQRKLTELQTDFVNNMTHEFQTPISSILLSSNSLLKEQVISNPERITTYANLINKESNRLKNQVEQLLEKTDVKKQNLKFEKVQVHELLHDLLKVKTTVNKEINIRTELQATKDTIVADALHCLNVFYNILENAIKYTEQNTEIIIKTYNRKNQIIIVISDNGKGIPKKHLKKVFRKFYRIPPDHIQEKKGFGLGLYYVQKVIAAHNAKIDIRSMLDYGTDVILNFKLAK
ncbi:sensor histidine kinase [Chondrinema litorale]|uniref:sensor histidine kinase n=1 Tax=Chondrinema litorale TaxID=2994555 RepID=UPI002543B0D9|nr:HAMP domain-containing sensor histidine kinase [Chondrinema litorale]UZR92999.1 HAMP domain-containing sensor histidine kinase [Chondrinema litorale]